MKTRPKANSRLAVIPEANEEDQWLSKFEVNFALPLGYK